MSVYDEALKYIDLGWALVPIPAGTKGPNQPGWNLRKNLVTTKEGCEFWKDHRDWNIGVQLEESNIVVLDIDNIEYTKLLFFDFGLDYDDILRDAPRILGRDGHDKALFRAPPDDLKFSKVVWPHPTEIHEKTGRPKTITVLELRCGAVQDVLPPSVHPDTQREYQWINKPYDAIPELPKEILTIWKEFDHFKARLRNICPWSKENVSNVPKLTRKANKTENGIIQQYNAAHSVDSLLYQYGYTKKGDNRWLSPFSSTGLAGVITFPDGRVYSHHASEPWGCEHSLDAFDLFCQMEHNGNIQSALSAIRNEFDPVDYTLVEDFCNRQEKKTTPKKGTPDYLLTIPGILSEVVNIYNDTAKKPQPQFAVSAALALGSVVCGRRFVTDQSNFSSIYILDVAKTSGGKEHAKKVVERVLELCGVDETLIGPAGYTSAGGVMSALQSQPCHIAIIDEVGKLLESSRRANNSNKLDSLTILMEAFGRLDGTLRPTGYSTMTMSQKQRDGLQMEKIVHPALTILGMTTPETLYANLNSDSITSGLIPRFVIVESEYGRPKMRRINADIEVSEDLKRWIWSCVSAHSGEGNLSEGIAPDAPPGPVLIRFEDRALELLDEFEERIHKQQDALDAFSMSAMLGKTVEIAYRISLIVAISCGHACIYAEDTEWAIAFTEHYAMQAVSKMRQRLAGSDFEAICKEVIQVIVEGAERGATEYEISRKCGLYRSVEPRVRKAVIEAVICDYSVIFTNIPASPSGGKPRGAYICLES